MSEMCFEDFDHNRHSFTCECAECRPDLHDSKAPLNVDKPVMDVNEALIVLYNTASNLADNRVLNAVKIVEKTIAFAANDFESTLSSKDEETSAKCLCKVKFCNECGHDIKHEAAR